jgi:DHA3 family macrolide efflux protein-like MFS transporter
LIQTPVLFSTFLLIVIIGGSTSLFYPVVWAMLQEVTPEHLLGRVFTTFSVGSMASAMVGMAGFGWAADALGACREPDRNRTALAGSLPWSRCR